MKRFLLVLLAMVFMIPAAQAVTRAEDIATTIILRGHACPGRTVSNVSESVDASGNKTIQATCPNGARYQVNVSASGRVSVQRLN
ncbi:hypothetical protein MMIC_P1558 [Mariprofundus micogutta]|uniref:Secreted protein n=1 Tax=Mariprofundus micogutta TaxID=1921010 RepID=A0A1L8CP29_9PROT|nr:hypothetical protein [Mariprofundus micogutta]GAV20589.1 hypothetical protein MMIC_P1558 [Mariprofundus micogutta]